MSRMKDFLIGRIERLCAQSGYEFEFLMNLFYDYCDCLLYTSPSPRDP